MALIGSARVSTLDQSVAAQRAALGCARVCEETASGANRDRPGLAAALDYMREGDALVVRRFDRLARSLRQLIETIEALEARGMGFRLLTEAIDTTTPKGRLVVQRFGARAGFECGAGARTGGGPPPETDRRGPEGREGAARRARDHRQRCRTPARRLACHALPAHPGPSRDLGKVPIKEGSPVDFPALQARGRTAPCRRTPCCRRMSAAERRMARI